MGQLGARFRVGRLGVRWGNKSQMGWVQDGEGRGILVGCQTGDRIPDRGCNSRQGWCFSPGWSSRQGMGYQTQVGPQTGDDGVPDRG